MENTQLTITDLMSIKSLLDTACNRGTFKGSEMSKVGEIYDRLTAFLEVSKSAADAAAKQAQGETHA